MGQWGNGAGVSCYLALLTLPLLFGLATGAQAQVQCTTANSDDSYAVPSDWALKPSALAGGTTFRLLFMTSTTRNAQSTNIADYNTFVQTRAKAGHSAITDSCDNLFKVVGSTSSVNARVNTNSESSDTDAAIYWLNGPKAADNYADFYDGSWDSGDTRRNESGGGISANATYIGTNTDGTAHSNPLGSGRPRLGLFVGNSNPLSGLDGGTNTALVNFYGLSPIFKVALPQSITITGGSAVTEGTAASFTVTADPAPSASLSVSVSVTDDANSNFVSSADEGSKTAAVPTTGSVVYLVSTTADMTDETDGEITMSFVSASSYVAGDPSSASVMVKDNDPTIVTLARVGSGGGIAGGQGGVHGEAGPCPDCR